MYIYIFEDGTTQKHPEPPTPLDLEYIGDGTLMVLACDDVLYVDTDSNMIELEKCYLTDKDDQECGYCHLPS